MQAQPKRKHRFLRFFKRKKAQNPNTNAENNITVSSIGISNTSTLNSSLPTNPILPPKLTQSSCSINQHGVCIEDGILKDNIEFENVTATRNKNNIVYYTKRFVNYKEITATLQGKTYTAFDNVSNQCVCVKQSKLSCIKSKTSLEGLSIFEDFNKEIELLKKITYYGNNSKHDGFSRYIDDWKTETHRHVVLEKCDLDLFDYSEKILQSKNKLQPNKHNSLTKDCWMNNKYEYGRFKIIKNIFKQLVDTVSWFHNDLKICHLDLSLENIMLHTNNEIHNGSCSIYQPKVKIIDFGLCQDFTKKTNFLYNKGVGKSPYQSPEVFQCRLKYKNKHKTKKRPSVWYDARKADVWCLGIILFILIFWCYPYKYACPKNDKRFKEILGKRNGIAKWAKKEKKSYLITPQCLDLLQKILVPERERYSIDQVLEHPFLNSDNSHD